MSSGRDEGPVYYREIHKNAFLKRIPLEMTGCKLRPLTNKKPISKSMWTLFCVHNGRTPYLEQYPEHDSVSTMTHKPIWSACLKSARHVTASVKPHIGEEYDFLIDTEQGPIRMLAPDWDAMQDWVNTLRNKLQELKILSGGENVYCTPPSAPPPRAPARDPTSPLPPTPPVPPDRVPGIELTPNLRSTPSFESSVHQTQNTRQINEINRPQQNTENLSENIDISNWDSTFSSNPSTSQEIKNEPKKSVAKICGQNICLDDSVLKRSTSGTTDSDDEYVAEMNQIHNEVENLDLEGNVHNGDNKITAKFKQTVVVNTEENCPSNNDLHSEYHGTNVTVIQVSNKDPPHTAIPVLGAETEIFDFDFKQNVSVKAEPSENTFINIVNTETNESINENGYGTVFSSEDPVYGHLSLTTTVNLTGATDPQNEVYEQLCLASTSNTNNTHDSPLPLRKVITVDKLRKSSLPNLEVSSDFTYEYLFPDSSQNGNILTVNTNTVQGNSNQMSNTASMAENPVMRSGNGPVNSLASTSVPSNVRILRSNVERSHSQNAYDSPRLRDHLIQKVQSNSQKREGKIDPNLTKPIWKRGLTELSLLSRFRGTTPNRRHESPSRHEPQIKDRNVAVAVNVVRRSRPEMRGDSSSVSVLQPLRQLQAATLRAEQQRGAAVHTRIPAQAPPVFCEYDKQLWIAWWGIGGDRCYGRVGDRVAALRGAPVRTIHDVRQLVKYQKGLVDILFHRVPLAKIFVLNKRDRENLGIKLDAECNIVSVEAGAAAGRAGLPLPGKWAVTEVNNRPINLLKGGEEEMNRFSMYGSEVSILIQPSALVKKIRNAIKMNKTLLGKK